MVYYGALSRGCQRCRQRKVKCDQQKPGCMRCERAGLQCPGFRDLGDLMFRDESQRIIRRAQHVARPQSPSHFSTEISPPNCCIFPAISQPLDELAASFFFTKYYSCSGPPFSAGNDRTWLADTYCKVTPGHALQSIIQAAGMAGLANVFHAPHVVPKSQEQYGRALAALQRVLSNPIESLTDTTLMTVLLLGFYEFITLDTWDRAHAWASHVDGAVALVQARGRQQFANERAYRLFSQVCGQVLYACMQHGVHAPPAMVELCEQLESAGNTSSCKRPKPLRNICFRFLRFRTAVKSGEITDHRMIRETARSIDRDLEAWVATLPSTCSYTTVDIHADNDGTSFGGLRHVYGDLWAAQAWNNWRTMRVVVNQIILESAATSNLSGHATNDSLRVVQDLSTDICISVASFAESTRT
ncbi:hypothetical protein VTK56DRAFT_3592 [Thermocarpiscus australiensis]